MQWFVDYSIILWQKSLITFKVLQTTVANRKMKQALLGSVHVHALPNTLYSIKPRSNDLLAFHCETGSGSSHGKSSGLPTEVWWVQIPPCPLMWWLSHEMLSTAICPIPVTRVWQWSLTSTGIRVYGQLRSW